MASVMEILLRAKGGKQVEGETKKASKGVSQLDGAFRKLGSYLAAAVIYKQIQKSIQLYAIQEEAITKLNAALRVQNDYTKENSKVLQDQASALQQATIYGDEAIITAQALLLNYGLTKEEVKKSIPIILDFAAATGKDVRAAADYAGRAILGQTSVLKTYGVVIDQARYDARGMVEVLETLDKQFGGTAKAIAKSGIGPMKQFQNQIGDLYEVIGETLIPGLNNLIGVATRLMKVLTGTNKETERIALTAKKAKKFLDEANISLGERDALLSYLIKKEWEAVNEFIDARTEQEEFTEGLSEKEKERLAELEKLKEEAREKESEAEAKEIQDRYNFRRQLGELDLKGTFASLEREFLAVQDNEVKQKAIFLAFQEYKKEARVQEAVEIEEMQGKITDLFVEGTTDWTSAWGKFRDYIVDVALRSIADEIIRTIGLAKALRAALGAVTGGGVLGLVGGLLGFQHGGTVPGPIGRPVPVMAHGGERFTPPGRVGNQGGGRGITIINHFTGTFIGSDETMWDRLVRDKIYQPVQRLLRKTGEQFSGK